MSNKGNAQGSSPLLAFFAALIISAALLVYFKLANRKSPPSLQDMEISRLTRSGKASGVAISPNGKRFAFLRGYPDKGENLRF